MISDDPKQDCAAGITLPLIYHVFHYSGRSFAEEQQGDQKKSGDAFEHHLQEAQKLQATYFFLDHIWSKYLVPAKSFQIHEGAQQVF